MATTRAADAKTQNTMDNTTNSNEAYNAQQQLAQINACQSNLLAADNNNNNSRSAAAA